MWAMASSSATTHGGGSLRHPRERERGGQGDSSWYCGSRRTVQEQEQRVLVYSGPGAGSRSVSSAVESLRLALDPSVRVDTITPEQLMDAYDDHEKGWTEATRLLVMPGGADVPYCDKLNGRGNELIREYVHNGGSYLGLCAGAYYGCQHVEFDVGGPLEVVGPRELGFYKGIARGCMYPGFHYANEDGAVAAPIRFRKYGKQMHGEKASTGGVGWEICYDYVNGGPGFVHPSILPRLQGSNCYPNQDSDSFHLGEEVNGHILSFNSVTVPGSSWLRNDHVKMDKTCSTTPHASLENVEVLAEYVDQNGAASAILCHVGSGKAVLCASHPELAPHWLSLPVGGGRSDAIGIDCVSVSTRDLYNSGVHLIDSQVNISNIFENLNREQHVGRLKKVLEASHGRRWNFWVSLLTAAGLEDIIISNETQMVQHMARDELVLSQ